MPDIHATADAMFAGGGKAAVDLPRLEITEEEISAVDALVGVGFAKSKGEARRLIQGGGARLDDVKVESVDQVVSLRAGVDVKVSSGKKKHALLALVAG